MLAGVRAAGGRVALAREAVRILVDDGRVRGVETSEGTLASRLVVDAAGPWAEALGTEAGGTALGLRPCRRHLLVTGPHPSVDAWQPVVWHLDDPWYLRPETGGLLVSPCDEDELPPGDVREDPAVLERGIERLVRLVPALADHRVVHSWAGLRTLSPDGACVVGPDPRLPGLFWVAGLGGHGMSAAGGLLRIVPEIALDGGTELLDSAEVSPARFA
jgi:D-arginine dehydrogenase